MLQDHATGKSTASLSSVLPLTHILSQVDSEKLAQLGGYKNANTANAVYYSAKKKLLAGAGGGSPRTPSKTSAGKGAKGSGKKRTAPAAESEDDEEVDVKPSVEKKAKGKKAKVEMRLLDDDGKGEEQKVKQEESEELEGYEFMKGLEEYASRGGAADEDSDEDRL